MNNQQEPSPELSATAAEASALRGRARRDQGIDSAHPLGPKAAALHVRRRRLVVTKGASTGKAKDLETSSRFTLASEDGGVAFVLKPSNAGLYVERTQRRPLDAHIVQSMVFENVETFFRWCEADPVRFDHPVLYKRLRRDGDDLLHAKR